LIAEEGENINGPITVKIADFGLSNVLGTVIENNFKICFFVKKKIMF